MIHNRYLPLWLHRICNGMFGAALLLCIGSVWYSEPAGSWHHVVSRCLIWTSIPVGIILALAARRFSIVEGVGGGDGYDELHETDDKNPLA
jgi:heme/copper-type cytochrome/quinol oxidase subunit 2